MAIKYSVLIFLILIIPAVSAEPDNYDNYSVLEIYTKLSSSIYTSETGRNPIIDELDVNLTFLPRADGDRQLLVARDFSADPEAESLETNDYLYLSWKDPREQQFFYEVDAKLKIINRLNKIKGGVNFPLDSVPSEAASYLAPTEFIDFNQEIRDKASDIVAGETDYYHVIHKMAAWVEQNIKYDLNTLTSEAVQKSSWVYENKVGVCDELTNLYISFLRSIGIPARFVGGQVYSNSDKQFGNHGWAEVFYPGVGWIPVDVTFGQIGWIDATHVKFKESMDSGDPSAMYRWKTSDIDFKRNPIAIKTDITKATGDTEKHVGIMVEPMKKVVGPGSYVPVIVTIANPNDYYVPLQLQVTKAPEVYPKDGSRQMVLMSPLEEKELYFIIKIPDDVKDNFVYTTMIEVRSAFGSIAQAEVEYEGGAEVMGKEWAEDQVRRLSPVTDKEFLPDIRLNCSFEKPYYYEAETARLRCSVRNIGNMAFENIRICYYRDCNSVGLSINEEKEAGFDIPLAGFTDERVIVTAETSNMARKAYARVRVVGVPDVKVTEFRPASVRYGDESQFSFQLNTTAPVRDIRIEVNRIGYSAIEKFDTRYEVLAPFDSRDFFRGKVDVVLAYHDIIGKEYGKELSYVIEVTDKPWHIRFLLWIESFLN